MAGCRCAHGGAVGYRRQAGSAPDLGETMPTVTLNVAGIPAAQPRQRFARRGNFVHTYTPDTADGWKAAIEAEAIKSGVKIGKGVPIKLTIMLKMPRPKSRPVEIPHIVKPDLDNLAKAVMDALSDAGIWHDDAQVYRLYASKCYSSQPPGATIELVWDIS